MITVLVLKLYFKLEKKKTTQNIIVGTPKNTQSLVHEFEPFCICCRGTHVLMSVYMCVCVFISRKEIAELRGELDEERLKRMALQVTLIPIATHAGLSTFITLIGLAKY